MARSALNNFSLLLIFSVTLVPKQGHYGAMSLQDSPTMLTAETPDINFQKNRTVLGSKMKFVYPNARRDDTVVDNYHGVKIPDPYRWLEDPNSEETKAFIRAQNEITFPYLESGSTKRLIHDRLEQLWNFPKYTCPRKHGSKYYFYKNTGLQHQSVFYVQDSLDGEPRVFLDPNTLSLDGTVSIAMSKFSEDGNIFAYGLSSSGSDWRRIYFMNTQTGEKYPEILEQVRYSPIVWTHDNLGIFYGRYPHQQMTDGSVTVANHDQKLYYHRIGTPQSEDVLVVEFPENPLWTIGAMVSDCGKWLIVTPTKDSSDNSVYFTELKPGEEINRKFNLTPIVETFDATYSYITNVDTKAIFLTDKNASNHKLIVIDLLDYGEDKWTDLLPEHPHNILEGAIVVDDDKFLASYIQDVKDVLQLHSLKSGELIRTFPLDVGTIVDISGDKKHSEIFYKFTSFLTPGIIYTIDLKKDDNPKIYREIKLENFNPNSFKTVQVFYPSKDGTKIPMFIVMKEGAKLDGSMPALLYGYGGFNINVQPSFSVERIVFIQHLNGVLAIPNIRGGGEYGKKWYDEGRLLKKQNSYDDFQSAAEYLITNGYTTNKKLTIEGRSNGGLLVGACMNQRPDLFGAVIAHVGVMDLLRFHKFTIGHFWVSDYGSSEDLEQFKNLLKISPLHNIKAPEDGGQYPAALLLSADHDDRVVPLHTLKLIAALQYEIGRLPQQTNSLLGRLETRAGHGSGLSTSKQIEEKSDVLTFIVKSLGLEFKP